MSGSGEIGLGILSKLSFYADFTDASQDFTTRSADFIDASQDFTSRSADFIDSYEDQATGCAAFTTTLQQKTASPKASGRYSLKIRTDLIDHRLCIHR